MVLFYAEHNGIMTNFISMRFLYHPNEEAVLFMQQAPPAEICRKMETGGLFTKVVDVNVDPAPKLTFTDNTPEGVERQIVSFYDNLFYEHNIDLNSLDKIYYATDTAATFSLYLCLKKIKFNYVEIINTQITRIEERYNDGKPIVTPALWNKMREYDVLMKYPEKSDLLEKYYIYPESPVPQNYSSDRIVKLNFNELLDSFDDKITQKIANAFDFTDKMKLHTPNNVVIATSGAGRVYAITKLVSSKLPVIFQIMMDYYLPEKVRIISKPHPRRPIDIILSNTNSKAQEIPKWFPVEYLPYFKNLHIEYLLLADDGLIHKLKGRYAGKVIYPNDCFFRYYFFILTHRYFAALKLFETFPKYRLRTHCVHSDTLSVFAQNVIDPNINTTTHDMKKIIDNDFIIVSNLQLKPLPNIIELLKTASDNAIIVFTDILNRFWCYDMNHPELLENFIVQKIEKKPISQESNIISDTYTEYSFIFCKNKDIRNKISSMPKYSRMLHFTGIELTVSIPENWEQNDILQKIRISALENYLLKGKVIPASEEGIRWDHNIKPMNENNYLK